MPKFFDMDALQKRVEKAIADAYKEPDAKTPVAFTKGKHLAILNMTNALVGEVVKKSCELFRAHKARVDDLERYTLDAVIGLERRLDSLEKGKRE